MPGLAVPVLVLVLAAPASAERPRALIVGPPTGVLTALLEDEVRALGMDVEVVPSDVFPSWPEIRQLADVRGATVALAVGPQESAIGVWLIDRSTGDGSMRTVVVAPGDPRDGARVAAVRAVELVRIGLRVQRGAPTASAVAIADPAVEAHAPIEEPARLWLALGAGTLWAPGGLEPSAILAATVRYRVIEQLSLAVAISFPLTPSDVSAAEGSAAVRPWWTWLEARWTFLGDRGMFVPDVGIGLGAVAATMRGSAREPFVAADDVVAAFAWHAVAGLEVRPLRQLSVRLDAWCGTTAPGIGVRFGNRRVATWGLPLIGGALALAVGW